MNTFEQVIVIACVVLLVIGVLVLFVMSLFGTDLVIFDRYRTANPKLYRNLKKVCRVNGLMVAVMSVCGIVAAPFAAFGSEGSWLLAGFALAASGIFLWLSIRWFRWSLKP